MIGLNVGTRLLGTVQLIQILMMIVDHLALPIQHQQIIQQKQIKHIQKAEENSKLIPLK